MKIDFTQQSTVLHILFASLTVFLLLISFTVNVPPLSAQDSPYCTAGTPRDFSDRYCDWNSGIGEWECKTSLEGCVVERYTCGTSSCSVSVGYYCLVQNNGRDCYAEQETRTTSCTNNCDGGEPDPDPDPTPPPPPEDEEEQTLRVQKNGTGTGTVTSSPSGINCGSTCSQTSESRRQWDLTASPASGSTFTGWSIAEYSYNSTCLRRGGKNNSCTEWAQADTCGSLSQCRVNVSRDSSRTVTATFTGTPALTLYGTLDVTNPTSRVGEVGDTFSYSARRTGGTATGTVTYSNPRCTRGFLGLTTFAPVSGSYSGSSDRTFSCVYPSPSVGSPTFANVHGARMTINQGAASRTVSAGVNVGEALPPPPPPPPPPAPVLNVQLNGPSSGTIGQVLNFRAVRLSSSTATGALTYTNPTCGSGGTLVWPISTNDRFSCEYGTTGNRNVSIDVTQGGVTEPASRNVAISEPTINTVDVQVDPQWIPRGGSTTVSWTTDPPNPGASTVCRVNSGGPIRYNSANSLPVDNIQQATEFTVRCENDAPSSAEGSATVYILPSYSEF